MAENTVTTNAQTDAEKLAEYLKTVGSEKVPSRAKSDAIQPTLVAQIEPKDFECLPCPNSKFESFVAVLTYQDITEYVGYASELYEYDEKNKPIFDTTWQRGLDSKRVREASEYLANNELHFFPSIIVVPQSPDSCLFSEGMLRLMGRSAILALDGQHRVGGIIKALKENLKEHPELANECIVVQVLKLYEMDTRRQVFADINRSPRKVSKALNLAFDTSDRTTRIAKAIINHIEYLNGKGEVVPENEIPVDENGQPNYTGLSNWQPNIGLFDGQRTTPLAKSTNLMTLTNLVSLIGPISKVVNDKKEYRLSEEQLRETVAAILDNFPDVGKLRQGYRTFEQMKKEWVFVNSTFAQAIGSLMEERLKAKNEKNEYRIDSENFASTVGQWIAKVRDTGNWALTAKVWNDKDNQVVVNGKSVGTQKGFVKTAWDILRNLTSN